MEREAVKSELARIRELSQNTEAICKAKERRRRRMALLKRSNDADGEAVFATFESEINEVSALEARYIAASGSFGGTDRTILLEGLMGGKPYRILAEELGYSTEGVRKRARCIIIRLSKMF